MRGVWIGLAMALAVAPGLVKAQQPADRCYVGGATDDEKIQWCAVVIGSGQATTPNLAAAYNNRAIGYKHKGLYDQAIADYTQAIALQPDFAIAYANRGGAYEKKDRYDLAIADYNRAIALQPNYPKALNDLAFAYHLTHRDAEGLADADKAVALAPTANHLETRAELYEGLGRHGEAIADYRAALRLDPTDQDSMDGLKRLGATP